LAIEIRFEAAMICIRSQCSTFNTWQNEGPFHLKDKATDT
jgi:hypothetical protein